MKKQYIGTLAALLIALSFQAEAGRYEGAWWSTGDGSWWYGTRDKNCNTDCLEGKGKTTSKKDAKKEAKKAAKNKNKKSGKFMDLDFGQI